MTENTRQLIQKRLRENPNSFNNDTELLAIAFARLCELEDGIRKIQNMIKDHHDSLEKTINARIYEIQNPRDFCRYCGANIPPIVGEGQCSVCYKGKA